MTSSGNEIKDEFLNMLFTMLQSSVTRDTNLPLIQLIYGTNNKLVTNATDNIYIMLSKN